MALWREPAPTADELFLAALADDTEDAPWMVMGTAQFWSASTFAHTLEQYARDHRLPWFVACMLPIRFEAGTPPTLHQLAPDCFVSFVPDHARTSYDLREEEVFPAFVLEVVSPSSVERDSKDKLRAYGRLGVQEYVLFTPSDRAPGRLAGYRCDGVGRMQPWPSDADGSLWSDVLGLRLIVQDGLLRAWTAKGEPLRTLAEEARAREAAEKETARLRLELERLLNRSDR